MSLDDFNGCKFINFKNKSGNYHILNLLNNKIYFGSAKNLYSRMTTHYSLLNLNKHHNKHLQNAWNKYGEENFKFFVNQIIEDGENVLEREQFNIDLFKQYKPELLYNINPIAGSLLGFKHSEETRKKMSEHSAKNNLGKPMSEDAKKKLSETNLGKKHSEESKIKMSISRKGKPKPESFKEKIKGENNIKAKLTELDVINIKLRMLTETNMSKIAREFGIGTTQIYRIRDKEQWGWVDIPEELLCQQAGDL